MLPHLEFFERNWLKRQVEVYDGEEVKYYEAYAKTIEKILKKLSARWAPLAIAQARAKTTDSFADKCLRKADKYDDPVHQLTDLCGGRIIATTLHEAELLCRQLQKVFTIIENDDTAKRHALDAFGYMSVHFLVQIPPDRRELLGVEVPSGIGERVAEIQVRTLLQHAHSEITHDRLYKSKFKAPEHYKREAARVAAELESTDLEFAHFVKQLDAYVGDYAAQMKPADRQRRIDDLLLLLELKGEPAKEALLALRISRLARSAWDWDTVIEVLDNHKDTECLDQPAIQMELGHALYHKHHDNPMDSEFIRGLGLLELIARVEDGFDGFLEDEERIRRATALGWLGRALMKVPGRRDVARQALEGAVQLAPEDPYFLSALVELDLIATGSDKHLNLLAPSLRQAASRCMAHIEAGIEVVRAWLTLAKIRFFLNEDDGAFEALAFAAACTENHRPLADFQQGLDALKDALIHDRPKVAILDRAASILAKAIEARSAEIDRATHNWRPLSHQTRFDPAQPVLIIAGRTATPGEPERLKAYEADLRAILEGYQGQILSGGTTSGVCGVLASIVEEHNAAKPESIRLVGYVPQHLPPGTKRAEGNTDFIETRRTREFTLNEPLQMWADLLHSGIDPADVVLLCLGGEKISAAELFLARAIGAKAMAIDDASDAVTCFTKFLDFAGGVCSNAMLVPDDPATLDALLGFHTPGSDPDWDEKWDDAGCAVHEAYVKDQHKNAKEPNLLSWEHLSDEFKHSSRHQIAYSVHILRNNGFSVEQGKATEPGATFKFTDGDADLIERMSEAEHGRWNAERLHQGWRHGVKKDVKRKISPYLVPWVDLPDEIKDYDRSAVRNWPEILAKAGWKVERNKPAKRE